MSGQRKYIYISIKILCSQQDLVEYISARYAKFIYQATCIIQSVFRMYRVVSILSYIAKMDLWSGRN